MFFLGIDLGTTNCSAAFSKGEIIEDASIYQAVSDDLFEEKSQLPSFFYIPKNRDDFSHYPRAEDLSGIVGYYAKEQAKTNVYDVVQSAKSWISAYNEQSSNKILPFTSASSDSKNKISPVEAQSKYLQTIYDQVKPTDSECYVVVTVPASFNEYAKNLTLEATKMAGIQNAILLEEPQAAFYNWMYYQESKDASLEKVLVIDIGGGTTDFSLLQQNKGLWNRKAVGNHLLLGGDNIDLALTFKKESELGRKLNPDEFWQVLTICRDMKEGYLGEESSAKEFVLKGSGSKLFHSNAVIKFQANEVRDFIKDGFFPQMKYKPSPSEKLKVNDLGFRKMGLPYEKNPNITDHLMQFVIEHCPDGVDAVLFHGGTLESQFIQDCLLKNLNSWFKNSVKVLKNPDSHLGVSHGACIYALAKNGQQDLIQSGLSHSYFIATENTKSVDSHYYCIGEKGQLEGVKKLCPHKFQLKGNQKVSFPLFMSPQREHLVGTELLGDNTMQLVSNIDIEFKSKDGHFPVQIESCLNSTGQLQMFMINSRNSVEKFELEFRTSVMQSSKKSVVKAPLEAERLILQYYGKSFNSNDKKGPLGLLKKFETIYKNKKSEWSVEFCRYLVKTLIDNQRARRRKEVYEANFYNATGYLLRPGFGHEGDADLIKKLDFVNFTHFPKSTQNRVEYWIFLRRISGGLSEEFQQSLWDSYKNYVLKKAIIVKLPGSFPNEQEIKEMRKCFCFFEYLNQESKTELFNFMFTEFKSNRVKKSEFYLFHKLVSVTPSYASVQQCLDQSVSKQFFEYLCNHVDSSKEMHNTLNVLFKESEEALHGFDDTLMQDLKVSYNLNVFEIEESSQEEISYGETLPLGLKILK
ncbi:MAG: Hsp70 family protein [Candidatus Cloacimonetes bacterium]|nr:Hsp70 family protein [Candidatus Cloacimonadota bacterium]